eukprot:787958-Amphidinium_carterae.1
MEASPVTPCRVIQTNPNLRSRPWSWSTLLMRCGTARISTVIVVPSKNMEDRKKPRAKGFADRDSFER